MNETRLKTLPDGRFLAVDERGTSHICDTVEKAMRYIWNENEGTLPRDKKYKKDVSPLKPKKSLLTRIPDLNLDQVYFEWLTLLENGEGDKIDDFLALHPDFAETELFDIPSADLDADPLMPADFSKHRSLEAKRDERKATWAEVKEKGLSLLMDFQAVYVNFYNSNRIVAKVEGYHGTYNTMLLKKAHLTKNNEPSSGLWFCTCEWGQWCNSGHRPHDGPDSTGSVKIQNRFCSHAFACYLLLHNAWIYQAYISPETGAVLPLDNPSAS